jgi:transcriptional regulator with XRE-family HTH domain
VAPKRATSSATGPWGPAEGRRLAEARAAHRHNQKQCLARIKELGGRAVSQPTFSKWEQGIVQRLDEETVRAIWRYYEESGLGIAAELERALSNEPLLSDRQARLVDGFAVRLIEGPMSDAEAALAESLLRSVGL